MVMESPAGLNITKVEHIVLPPSPDLRVLKFICRGPQEMSKKASNGALFLQSLGYPSLAT